MRSILAVFFGSCLVLFLYGCALSPTPTPAPTPTPTRIPLPTVSGPPRLQITTSPNAAGDKQNGSLLGMGFQPFEHVALTAQRNGQPFTGIDCQIQAPLERNQAIAYPNGNFVCFFSDQNGPYTDFDTGETMSVKAVGEKGSTAEVTFTFEAP